MAKLPFIVEPKLKPRLEVIGTEESGQIEIERKGYLTAAERSFMQSQLSDDTTTQEVVRLCRVIGQKDRIDMEEAYNLLSEAMTGSAQNKKAIKIAETYAEEIDSILSAMLAAEARKSLMSALCLLMYRIDAEVNLDQVMEMHPDLMDALVDLYKDEESRSTRRLNQLVEEDGEGTASAIDALEKK